MNHATLVIMAAGMGSRFGSGIKQLEPVGPHGEIIMDYSIYDAMRAGFDKVVFVIRKDLEKEFRRVIGDRIAKIIKVEYAFQEKEDIPQIYQKRYKDRQKPWGTGQAILACKDVIKEPFLVINADDYYGKHAYEAAYQYLAGGMEESQKLQLAMVGFVLKNTLSQNGGVTRGLCQVDHNQMLIDIVETRNIERENQGAVIREGGQEIPVDAQGVVSMNMWGLHPSFFEVLETGFENFLETLTDEQKDEYLLPNVIGNLLKEKKAEVKVLQTQDQWFGVTYKEDKEYVVRSVRKLIEQGVYPESLFQY